MNSLDLDALPPVQILANIKEASGWKVNHDPHHIFSRAHLRGGYSSRVGIKHVDLLDWRALERRYAQLAEVSRQNNAAFWDSLRELYNVGKETGASMVWLPDADGVHAQTFDGRSLGSDKVERLVKEAIPRPSFHAVVPPPVIAAKLRRLQERSHVALGRAATYCRGFKYSVEARLLPIIQEKLNVSTKDYRYFKPALFIFSNEGRQYFIKTTASSQMEWAEDMEIFSDDPR